MTTRGFKCATGMLALLAAAGASCTATPDLFHYLTQETTGNIQVQFINNTDFRASFSFGTYNSLDRNPPGPVSLSQQRLEAHTTSSVVTAPCRHDAAVGTQEYIQRVIDTGGDTGNSFDADAFTAEINFSSAAQDSPSAALPTEGTADGIVARLGIDFKCADLLIITFSADPNAPGGFRIDLLDVPAQPTDQS